ncbi:serine/threonine-protein kinase [Polyangium mundeleinium]|uniref:Serine/threonine-protein kinase n=1 Tax=Polyangium mundeleinium TaxID=2995306 RepID=A0ABT5EUK0_9BACT|nr:serine/threonine-protein kinase [Polyangium mundeleinium]MDC0745501.1 serine/threonine-protein kinase [Polyangium mundeleinium]
MLEGDQITPKMRLSRHLGQEGKSQVWVAEHVGFGKDVAVKLMGRALSRNSSPLHRFQREADVATRQIKSPHVAQILEHGLTRTGMPYLVMELLEGEDLGSRIARTGPLAPKDAARLVSQLAKGLVKAHLLGLVHRNLKPGNVFLTEPEGGDFEAKVLDLGLSVRAGISSMGRTTSDATHMISPEFMSPEQIFGQKDVDFRADLWTLAVLAYYALSGRAPFSGQNLESFGNAIEEGRFEPITTLVPGLPPSIDSFFAKALQRDPTARYSAAKELADEFERALGVEIEERTSRTSFPLVTQRSSSPGSRPFGATTTTGSMRRPKLSSLKEISDRIPADVRDAALRPPEVLPVTVTPEEPRKSSALVIVVLALLGIGTIVAGLSLLSGDSTPPPKTAPTAPRR